MAKANGRVRVGFSHPVVAKYDAGSGTPKYTEGRVLARGVGVKLAIKVAESNDFYADDVLAESESGGFAGGTMTLTVDGMHTESEALILGLGTPEQVTYGSSQNVKVTKYGAAAQPPYVGVGYVTEYKSGDVSEWVPTIVRKVKFKQPGDEAKTRGENTDWQTQEIEADIFRDDSETADWKWVGEAQSSRLAAWKVVDGLLNVAGAMAAASYVGGKNG